MENYEIIKYYFASVRKVYTDRGKLCNDKMVLIRRNVHYEVNIFK